MKSPLAVYVVWHPSSGDGRAYAEYLYSTFCRDVQYPLSRGMGIPVFFRSAAPEGRSHPADIAFTESEKTAVVILVDDAMYEDASWSRYVEHLLAHQSFDVRLFPVALSQYAFEFHPGLTQMQFINLHRLSNVDGREPVFEEKKKKLKSELLHDLSRLLLAMPVGDTPYSSTPPIRVFISHAKKDGETQAMQLRDYINSKHKLKTFFDTNDIANGASFEQELRNGIEMTNSVLVIFQSDAYASREWCRMEVIIAKRFKCPIVVMNAIEKGEQRSFPYIGNVPTIRWNNNFADVIDLALIQMLHNLFAKAQLRSMLSLYGIEKQWQVVTLTSPPELFNLLDIKKMAASNSSKPCLVIYPDPPLGNEELLLLQDFDENLHFITPLLLPSLANEQAL